MHADAVREEAEGVGFKGPTLLAGLSANELRASTESHEGPRILVLGADRLSVELIARCLARRIACGRIAVTTNLRLARESVLEGPLDLLICDLKVADGDVIDAIYSWGPSIRSLFIVTTHREPLLLERLTKLRTLGAFDPSSDDAESFGVALEAILDGRPYWSAGILQAILAECFSPTSALRRLTATERRVLAVVGAGASDKIAATQLDLRESSVSAVRRALHRKLGVHNKEALWRAAVRLGFVCIEPD